MSAVSWNLRSLTPLSACLAVLVAGCAQPGTNASTASDERFKQTTARAKQVAAAEGKLRKAIIEKDQTKIDSALAENYGQLILLCRDHFAELERDQERYATAEARTNVIGSLIAVLGSVATYAPAKTVLTALGISSSGSGSVSSGLTQMFSDKSDADKNQLTQRKTHLALLLDRYDGMDSRNDPSGARRSVVLARARMACMGLAPDLPQANGLDEPDPKPADASPASADPKPGS